MEIVSEQDLRLGMKARALRSLDRGDEKRSPRLIVIATENTYADKQYFEEILETPSNVKIEVLETSKRKGDSAPQHVLARLESFKKYYEEDDSFGVADEFWLMVDVDEWPQLVEVTEKAIKYGYQLAVSNPCFEIWLLCHCQTPPVGLSKCSDVEYLLGQKFNIKYGKRKKLRRFDFPHFRDNIGLAVQRAIASDTGPDDILPQNPGTRVYRVVQSILDLKPHISLK